MKKVLSIVLTIVVCFVLTGCNDKDKQFMVSFETNGTSSLSSIIVDKNGTITFPEIPTKDGYIFNGWLLNGELFNEATPITKDIELTADWINDGVSTYKVLFIYNNETKDLEVLVEENTKVDKPQNPIKSGYKFKGWFLNDSKYDFSSDVKEDLVIVAYWELIETEVKKDTNNNSNRNNDSGTSSTEVNNQGESTTNTETINATKSFYCLDSSYTLRDNKCVKTISSTPSKEYYCNSGWNLSGRSCIKTTSSSDTIDGTPVYTCANNYALKGDKCEYYMIQVANSLYTCPSGQTIDGSLCYSYVYKVISSVTINESWSETSRTSAYNNLQNICSNSGGTIKTEDNKWNCYAYERKLEGDATHEFTCSSGYTLTNGACLKTVSTDAIVLKYNCPSGYSSSGSKCIKKSLAPQTENALYNYSCSSSYTLNGTICEKEFSMSASEKYSCPTGYMLYLHECKK